MRSRLLVSYHYWRNRNLDELVESFPNSVDFFADSGAFSAYHQGADVKLEDYIEWVHRWKHLFRVYANLDVIQNPAATAANQAAMEANGLAPLPVFHAGSDFSWFDKLLSNYEYIALAGFLGRPTPLCLQWLAKCFRLARSTGSYFHGLGGTRLEIASAVPWYSVDSSSWGGHKWGRVNLWDNSQRRFVQVRLGDRSGVYAKAALIRAHGGDPAEFATPKYAMKVEGKSVQQRRDEEATLAAINLQAWRRFESWLRRRHGEIGPAGDTGPKVYLADDSQFPDATGRRINSLSAAWNHAVHMEAEDVA